MPDAENTLKPTPSDWGTAFAALPMEAPPADGWNRMSRALDARGGNTRTAQARRARWPLWLATAAAVSAVALVPMLMREPASPDAPAPTVAHTAAPIATTPSPASASTIDTTPAVATTTVAPKVDEAVAHQPAATPRKRRPSPTAPPHTVEPRRLVADATPSSDTAATSKTDTFADVQSLQSESAQLEALVALARDDRVASANAASLAAGLDERIGRIDASLSQPGLADTDRTLLWQERVATLRELAGVETTQRWLTTHGERYDGALVSVD
ncbi:hypothetical protein [Lysobacter panacisoli]|uniref:Uncharacterized protein n=1 Tax=Lysobacter panacisoli TaxID=1255263 RepID=A0ABP9LL13_9GAMM|nr:hypothetical protein [Lysobacter panacisoli]